MSDAFVVNAEVRSDKGKGSSRRLRRLADKIPGIIYGGKGEPVSLTLIRKDLEKSLQNEAFYTHILTVEIDGQPEKAILKDLQRHPAKETVMHADFLRVVDDVKIFVRIPLHFINEDTSIGVKTQGGMVSHSMTELEVMCLPKDLPEYLEVDLQDVELGQIVHISDVVLPPGVESVELSHGEDHDQPIASIVAPKGSAEDKLEDAAAAEDTADEADADADADEGGSEE